MLLEQTSTQELVNEMKTFLNHLGQVPVEQRVGEASRAQTDEAAQRPRTCPYTLHPPEGIPQRDDRSTVERIKRYRLPN